MVVDDDSAVHLGHIVVQAGSGGAALDLLAWHPNVDLILLDVAMPGMSGIEVARQAQSKYPGIPILFVTGYVDKATFGDVSEDRIVKKPFVGDELAKKVTTVLIQRSRRLHENVVRLRP